MAETPSVTIKVAPDVGIQITTNLNDPVVIIGLLESAKYLLMSQPVQAASPIVKPTPGGSVMDLAKLGKNRLT